MPDHKHTVLDCPGRLELPRDAGWVLCDRGAAHADKHSGALDGKRYWWTGLRARARRFVPRQQRPEWN